MTTNFNTVLPNDIMAFVTDNLKANNDSSNKIREFIIANIFLTPENYFLDPEFGHLWVSLRSKLQTTLHSLASLPYESISIQQLGGMTFNYDFLIEFKDSNNQTIQDFKVEFKNNNSNVKDLAQFLELYDKDCKTKFQLFDYSYSEFYYDNFLDSYLAIDGAAILKPDKETYLKHVYDIKYKHPFFRHLYENKTNNKKIKDTLVELSRTQFLNTYASQFKFDKITEKIRLSQTNKIFLLWDKNEFHLQTLDIANINISGIIENTIKKSRFDIQVDNFMYNIRVTLNWGNNNGVANPRWKLKFIDK
jgi:hypothetical protein